MTISIRNQGATNQGISNHGTSNPDQVDTITRAIETALYYPSLKGVGWDDELLPSGD